MDTVGRLVSQLHVTHPAADPPLQATHAPSPPPAAAKADGTKPLSVRDSKKATAKDATAAGKGTKQQAAVYSRQDRQAAAPAGDAAKATAGTDVRGAKDQATASLAAAASDEPSPSSSRPLRQRAKAQPYWMSGAAGNSPSARPGPDQQAVPAASDAVLASDMCESAPAPAEQSHDNTANRSKAGGLDQKAGVTKRQARSSPHKEQQQPAKKSRAGSKQQPEERPETRSEAEVAAEVESGAGAGRVAKQGKAKEGHGIRQAGKAGKQQEEDDQATIANDAAVEGTTEAARKDIEVRQTEQPQDVQMGTVVSHCMLCSILIAILPHGVLCLLVGSSHQHCTHHIDSVTCYAV